MNLYGKMANLLEYPRPGFLACVDKCLALSSGEIRSFLQAFRREVQEMRVSRLQELYIDTFDFPAETSLYIGHHLFGEEIRRSLFMAELRGRYRESGLPDNAELPDHLSSILRFLGVVEAGEERSELVHHCLIPALEHLLRALKPENPYTWLLKTILFAWRQEDTSLPRNGEIAWIPFFSSSSPTSR